ncbi:hypothetical protein ACFS6H_16490 [Terrimonas rubra]|uniref:Uncharacterized protein n=1 Tax=Terrimonas rubra TaxID=1035890 RepID=A0ABW6A988_9BACT
MKRRFNRFNRKRRFTSKKTPKNYLKWLITATLIFLGFSFVTRLFDFFKMSKHGGILNGILSVLGVSTPGNTMADIENIETLEKEFKRLNYTVEKRHIEFAQMLRQQLQESRGFVAFWTSKVSQARANTIAETLAKIMYTAAPGLTVKDGLMNTDNPLIEDSIMREFACVYVAYGQSELADRGTPFLQFFNKLTYGTLAMHLSNYMPRTASATVKSVDWDFDRDVTLSYFFFNNPYLKKQ